MKKLLLSVPLALSLLAGTPGFSQTPQLFKDLTPGTTHSSPEGFFNTSNNMMYFIAVVGPSRLHQLWKSDGTVAGTLMVKDSLIITNIGQPINIRGEMNGKIYFTKEVNGSTTSSTTTELWESDGTTAGTTMVISLSHTQGSGGGGAARNFVVMGNKMFFSMGQNNGRELWVTDGTAAGTMEVIDLSPGTVSMQPASGVADQPMVVYNGKLYFSGSINPGNGELFSSDGTAAGTTLVAEVNPVTTMAGGSDPEELIIYNNELYFLADDGTSNSSEGIWKTDGTTTTKVFQNALTTSRLTKFKNDLYFANGIDLWKTNGTTPGTSMVNASAVTNMMGANNDYLFTVYQQYISSPPYYVNTFWRTDGTTNTQVSYDLANSASFLVLNNKMYISRADSGSFTSFGLWESDGVQATKIWNNGPGLHLFNNTFFFSHYDGSTGAGIELWSFAPGSTTTSSTDIASGTGIKVYPNPSTGLFTFDCGDQQVSALKVYDLLGKEVFHANELSGNASIDISSLPDGIYVYTVITQDNKVYTNKLMITK
jgi:ELWxxDGT repeat protein